jgi:hypothetical protein
MKSDQIYTSIKATKTHLYLWLILYKLLLQSLVQHVSICYDSRRSCSSKDIGGWRRKVVGKISIFSFILIQK